MTPDLDPVEAALLEAMAALERPSRAVASVRSPALDPVSASAPSAALDPVSASTLFEAQVTSRVLDHTARWLRGQGRGYYTIGSAGHESNGAVALALRPDDPALLHYRAGGFYLARASQVPGVDAVADVLRGMLAAATEELTGGRHKVFGSSALSIIPQTSTIASHLPRAVGLAASMELARSLGRGGRWPADAVVVCSLGDASLNHSTAQGALNWAALRTHRGQPTPILFVVEDNGLGISVATPPGWVQASTRDRYGLGWADADGTDPEAVFATTVALVDTIRADRRPAILHLHTVRFLGHAGTDVESAYRTPGEIRADLARDPILGSARLLVERDAHDPAELIAWYHDRRTEVRDRARQLADEPELQSVEEVMAPLTRTDAAAVSRLALRLAGAADLAEPGPEGDRDGTVTLARAINVALADVLDRHSGAIVFGQDVGRKGGVYGVTRGLQRRFGADRVFDMHLDEQSILGLALGAGLSGLLPIPEIQYLAYLHNAEDQLRGEAATLRFFSSGRFRNPMVVRIAGYAYQRGFGGHFHNDNSVSVLTDVPGLVVATPAHPQDAAPLLRACVALAETDGAVVAFVEPIARYHTSDLLDDGDGLWTAPARGEGPVEPGRAGVAGTGPDLTIVTWGNGVYLTERVRPRLEAHGVGIRVVDLRWLVPLPREDLWREATATGRVLVVDETRRTGGFGQAVTSALVEAGFRGPLGRVAAHDSFVPLGAAADLVLVSEDAIFEAAVGVIGELPG